MSTTPLSADSASEGSAVASVPMRFEVTKLPITDYDRAKAFYERLGWRLDIDFKPDGRHRLLQFTPPGSSASIQFGENGAPQGTLDGMILVVDDVEVARDELISRGVEVSDIWHLEVGRGQVPGLDPNRTSYASRATFSDSEGNVWQLQEITERLPGRV
jgi:catechol 2,3-dioxygenase-like lactoylglutathione lyase family enzyme